MNGMLRSVATENPVLNAAFIEIDSDYFSFLRVAADLITMKYHQLEASTPVDAIDRECNLL